MRSIPVLLSLLALAALPVAAALEEIAVEAPDVHLEIEGQRVDADSASVLPTAQRADAEVETKDQAIDVQGPSCRVKPDLSGAKKAPSACAADAPDAPRAELGQFVEYAIGLDLGAAATEEAAPLETTSTQAASTGLAMTRGQMAIAAAAAGASFAAIYGAWRVLKWTGLAAFVPLYSHLSDNELLDDANRAGIYRLIQAEPGISTKDIAERLGLAWGTVTHHLAKLEKRRFVVSKKYGKYRRFFANGHGGTEHKDQVAVLRLDRTGDIATLIQRQPGLTQKAVSTALGVSSSTILWHVKRLEGAQLITKVREGKQVRYYPGAGLSNVLVPAPAPTVPPTAA